MHTVYNFITGPLAWISFIVFFAGSLYRLIRLLVQVHQKEPFIYTYMSLGYSLRSIMHWMVPFMTTNWKRHPLLTPVIFIFHICLIVTPLFALAHVVLFSEAFDLGWGSLPERWTDIMTLIVIAACIFFGLRRINTPEVRYVTSASDYGLLALVALPFITGFVAYHQWFHYQSVLVLHILSGELMLMAIPFTRLSHMLFSPLTRAYMGSEFGAIRHAHDW